MPDEMRRAMAEFAVYSYKVLLFEKQQDGRFKRPEEYSRRAIATVSTHDLPTLRGYWEGRDSSCATGCSSFRARKSVGASSTSGYTTVPSCSPRSRTAGLAPARL